MRKLLTIIFILLFAVPSFSAEKPKDKTRKTGTSKPASAGRTFTDPLTNMEFVFVKGGCFRMGDTFGDYEDFVAVYSDEKPVHEVCVGDFYIGKYEVTQEQWETIMGNNPSYFNDCGDYCPVEKVSWNDIQEFIDKLYRKTGNKYRLPTEAEWEYSARSGGKKERYAGTSNESELGDYAWYISNSGYLNKTYSPAVGPNETQPVGQKKPNGLGIYDMSGNVREWVSDWYDRNYYQYPKYNPKGPISGIKKVIRGGSFRSTAWGTRAVCRDDYISVYWYFDLGFRLVRTK